MTSPHLTHDPTAVIGRRLGAYLIDVVLIMGILPVALFFVTAGLVEYTQGPTCDELEAIGRAGGSVMCQENILTFNSADDTSSTVTFERNAVLIAGGASLAYLVGVMWIVQGLTGSTAGKVITGVRTVDEQGAPPGMGRQLVRGLLWVVPDGLVLCGLPLVAIFTISLSNGHRRVGDMVARTYVVHAAAAGRPVAVAGAAVHPPIHEPGPPSTTVRPTAGVPSTPAGASTIDSPTGAGAPGWAARPVTGGPARTGTGAGSDPAGQQRAGFATRPVGAGAGGATPEPVGTPGHEAAGGDRRLAADPDTTDARPHASAEPGSGAEQAATDAGPRWDAARNAYIFWDASRHAWLVHDADTGEWTPIE